MTVKNGKEKGTMVLYHVNLDGNFGIFTKEDKALKCANDYFEMCKRLL
jgi:hypothetical protein